MQADEAPDLQSYEEAAQRRSNRAAQDAQRSNNTYSQNYEMPQQQRQADVRQQLIDENSKRFTRNKPEYQTISEPQVQEQNLIEYQDEQQPKIEEVQAQPQVVHQVPVQQVQEVVEIPDPEIAIHQNNL